jgi:hypothetical protein
MMNSKVSSSKNLLRVELSTNVSVLAHLKASNDHQTKELDAHISHLKILWKNTIVEVKPLERSKDKNNLAA